MTDTLEVPFEAVEAIPAQSRAHGDGREKIRWEDKLAPLKAKKGQGFLTWTYAKKSAATSRKAAISNRLFAETPKDNWTLAVRPVPNTDPETFGVYVQYNGEFTADEVTANAKLRADRAARTRGAAQAAQAATSAIGAEAPVETPAQRVAAAKGAQAK
jgi:hypothetical protein